MSGPNCRALQAVLNDTTLKLAMMEGSNGLRFATLNPFVAPAIGVLVIDSCTLRASLETVFRLPAERALELYPAEAATWLQWIFAVDSHSLTLGNVTRRRHGR